MCERNGRRKVVVVKATASWGDHGEMPWDLLDGDWKLCRGQGAVYFYARELYEQS